MKNVPKSDWKLLLSSSDDGCSIQEESGETGRGDPVSTHFYTLNQATTGVLPIPAHPTMTSIGELLMSSSPPPSPSWLDGGFPLLPSLRSLLPWWNDPAYKYNGFLVVKPQLLNINQTGKQYTHTENRQVTCPNVWSFFQCVTMSSSSYTSHFLEQNALQTSSQVLECKLFAQRLFQAPSDRHVYAAKYFPNPIRYNRLFCQVLFIHIWVFSFAFSSGRLPGPVKDLYRYIKTNGYNVFNSPQGLLGNIITIIIIIITKYTTEKHFSFFS